MMFEHSFDNIQKIAIVSLFFVICAILGWCFEICFYRINDGKFVKRGHGVGPWLPIYGVGGFFILLITYKFLEYPLNIFILSSLVAGIIEYITGWYLYNYCNHLRLWDYNVEKWNIGNIKGFVCFRSIFGFGLSGLLIDFYIFPFICDLALLLKGIFCGISLFLFLLFIFDIIHGYFFKNLEG